MDWEKLQGLFLDVGVAMIRSGGETNRVVDTLYRLAWSYGYTEVNFWVVPSNIQSTLTDPEGKRITQIRNIRGSGIDFDTLSKLNALSRWACKELPDVAAFQAGLDEIHKSRPIRSWVYYLALALGGWGFGLFFGCNFMDSLVALFASLIIAFMVRLLSVREGNPLILNFVVSFVVEIIIIHAVHLGIGDHIGCITIGVVMLMISGLGATNGLRDLIHLDTLSGVMNITASFTGAIGITLGIALPLFILRRWVGEEVTPAPGYWMQMIAGTVACVGFAIWFRVRGLKVLFCAIGVFLTTGVYLLVYRFIPDVFTATLIAAAVCGLYSQIMARINKTPATIFSTVCILTLIPGSSLYYAMNGFVLRDTALASSKAFDLIFTCFGIVLGYMLVEVINRYIWKTRR